MNSIKTGAITSFRGEYAFLSNYDQHEPFTWRGETFTSGEQAFAYAKTWYCNAADVSEWQKGIKLAGSPGEAKRIGRIVPLDLEVWDGGHKVWIMREIVHAKFKGVTGYGGKLVNTGATMLIEGNDWGDTFWGRVKVDGKWKGLNTLGVILMEERGLWLRG